MSPREKSQLELYEALKASGKFTAPYGILLGGPEVGRNYRTITFGFARTLDAVLKVYGTSFILYSDSRMRKFKANSVSEMLAYLSESLAVDLGQSVA